MILLFKNLFCIFLMFLSFTTFAKTLSERDVYRICKDKNFKDCSLIVALAKAESNFNPAHFNPEKTGSVGLLQIQCGTAKWLGYNDCKKLYNPNHNIYVGIKYLFYLMQSHEIKNIKYLISAWNAGRPIVCKFDNPGRCAPGQFFNQEYVDKVYDYYKYHKNEVQFNNKISFNFGE